MLTGTLVTAAGFMPAGFVKSITGQCQCASGIFRVGVTPILEGRHRRVTEAAALAEKEDGGAKTGVCTRSPDARGLMELLHRQQTSSGTDSQI